MIVRKAWRKAGYALAILGNLLILALPAAHGYAHRESAHHHDTTAVAHVNVEIGAEQSSSSHPHPEFGATVAPRVSLPDGVVFVAVSPLVTLDLEQLAERTVQPVWERQRIDVGVPRTAPPPSRAPPASA